MVILKTNYLKGLRKIGSEGKYFLPFSILSTAFSYSSICKRTPFEGGIISNKLFDLNAICKFTTIFQVPTSIIIIQKPIKNIALLDFILTKIFWKLIDKEKFFINFYFFTKKLAFKETETIPDSTELKLTILPIVKNSKFSKYSKKLTAF